MPPTTPPERPAPGSTDLVLIAATAGEAAAIAERLRHTRPTHVAGKPVVAGHLAGTRCRLAIAGIGVVNTAHALAVLLERRRPSLVLQFGVGGAYVPAGIPIGDVLLATEEIYGDVGVITPGGWLPSDAIGIPLVAGTGATPPRFNRFPLDGALVARAAAVCGRATGPLLTLSQGTGVRALGDALYHRFGAVCENMEGAAAAHVCALYAVPFLEVRGISNLVEDRDRSKWRLEDAARAAQDTVLKLVEHIDAILVETPAE